MSLTATPSAVPAAATDEIVRLTVTARSRAADFTLPAQLPLAEILPGVVRSLAVLEPDEVHAGYRVLTADGVELSLESSLLAQGVRDGAVLAVRVGADEEPPKVYDDVVEAVADVVEEQAGGWDARASRATMLAVAGVLGVLAAWTLHAAPVGDLVTAVTAGSAAVLLTLAGAVLGRLRSDVAGALVLFGLAIAFVVVAALSGTVAGDGGAVLLAGAGSAVVGLVGLAVLRAPGWPLLPAVTVGAIGAGVGGLLAGTSWQAAHILLVLDVLVVLAAGLLPRYALQMTRTAPPPMSSEAAVLADPEPIDAAAVRRRVDLSARVVHGLNLTLVLLHVLAAPVIAASGPLGLAVAWAVAVLIVLAARREARVVDVALAVGGGVLAVVTASVGAVLAEPGWAPTIAILTAVAAAAVLAALAFPSAPPLATARALDIVETLLLIALVPLTVLALGVLPLS